MVDILSATRALSKQFVRDLLTRLLLEIGKIPADKIVDGAALDSGLQMESIALVEVQVALEGEFDIEIDLIEIVEINDFAGIVDYIHALACRRIPKEIAASAQHDP